ncbi:glycine cleavage system protein R [Caenispirillum salinarum]|uniref:glycine cleavage system protein R n=1 Tax=Caenispirillum salinarum TaxID=859058 RepID=UPI00384DDB61
MSHNLLVTLFCPDRTGLVAAVTGQLFDMGLNLGDTTFAVLGTGAEFTAVCEAPDDVSADDVERALKALPEAEDARVEVRPFGLDPVADPSGRITHRFYVRGGDRPGLVARMAEVFGQYEANIVRMSAEHMPDLAGGQYVVRFDVNIPATAVERCLNTAANTAGELHLTSHVEGVERPVSV